MLFLFQISDTFQHDIKLVMKMQVLFFIAQIRTKTKDSQNLRFNLCERSIIHTLVSSFVIFQV